MGVADHIRIALRALHGRSAHFFLSAKRHPCFESVSLVNPHHSKHPSKGLRLTVCVRPYISNQYLRKEG